MHYEDASDLPSLDIDSPKGGVQISVRPDGRRLWVNVDGISILRISNSPHTEIEDNRVATEAGPGMPSLTTDELDALAACVDIATPWDLSSEPPEVTLARSALAKLRNAGGK
jgi:hypothetical protein